MLQEKCHCLASSSRAVPAGKEQRMINLSVQPYCEKCGDFEPEVEKTVYENFYGNSKCHTEITCKHKIKCENIMRYLQEEVKKE